MDGNRWRMKGNGWKQMENEGEWTETDGEWRRISVMEFYITPNLNPKTQLSIHSPTFLFHSVLFFFWLCNFFQFWLFFFHVLTPLFPGLSDLPFPYLPGWGLKGSALRGRYHHESSTYSNKFRIFSAFFPTFFRTFPTLLYISDDLTHPHSPVFSDLHFLLFRPPVPLLSFPSFRHISVSVLFLSLMKFLNSSLFRHFRHFNWIWTPLFSKFTFSNIFCFHHFWLFLSLFGILDFIVFLFIWLHYFFDFVFLLTCHVPYFLEPSPLFSWQSRLFPTISMYSMTISIRSVSLRCLLICSVIRPFRVFYFRLSLCFDSFPFSFPY